jgi:hypothetical protein
MNFDEKKIEMTFINYPHSKILTIWKLWKLKFLKIKNLLNIIKKFKKIFTTCKWGVMYDI